MNKSFLAIILLASVFTLKADGQTSPAPEISDLPSTMQSAQNTAVDPEKAKLIIQLLAQTKEVECAQERILQGLSSLKQFMPRVPQKYWTEYRDNISDVQLRDGLVRVYAKYFTTDDVRQLLAFYSTPAGKKFSATTISILRDAMILSQEVSKQAGLAVSKDIRADELLQQPRQAGSLAMPQLEPSASLPPIFGSTPTPSGSPTPTPRTP